jgi:BspA type Leucine rich repeat region (6 copies)
MFFKTPMKTGSQNLIIALMWLALPMFVQAQFTFTTNSGAITITHYTGTGGAVVIPTMTNGYPVTSIGIDAFQYHQNVTSVTITNNVISIGNGAYYACYGLANVTIGNSVTNIGNGVFYACVSLTNITVTAANPGYSSLNGAKA